MLVRRINTGSNIASIISNAPDGKATDYIIVDNPTKELDRLTVLANKKIEAGEEAFIKVKFDWEYGQRARVLEVVSRQGDVLTIHKFVSASNFDRHVLDLERLRDLLCSRAGLGPDCIRCCLVVQSDEQYIRIKELLREMNRDFDVEKL